jgi:hypothetical protein
MARAARATLDELAGRVRALGAAVPEPWLRGLLEPASAARWLRLVGAVSPTSGRATSPHAWGVLVFHGLLAACGGRAHGPSGKALAFDLAAHVAPGAVQGALARPGVSPAAQRALWAREILVRARPGEASAACLLALEACGALAETPAMLEEARWRLGPGAEATDAMAIAALVAEFVWHCHDDAGALLRGVAARALAARR